MEWRAIPGFPGYEASSEGEIRSERPRYKRGRGLTLRPWIVERHGRVAAYVSLHIEKKRTKQLVHRLVALAFHGLPPAGHEDCAHRDHNSLNNKASNLRWQRHSENVQDTYSDEARERRALWEHEAGMLSYSGPSDGCPF